MLSRQWFLTGVAASLILLFTISGAQALPRGMARNVFNPDALETIRGQVVNLDLVRMRSGRGCTLVLTLEQADKRRIEIHLGPVSFIEEQPMELREKDMVEVTGSWVVRRGTRRFVAGEVRKGDEVMRLRDEKGRALWLPHRE